MPIKLLYSNQLCQNVLILLSVGILLNVPAMAQDSCFIAKENARVIKQEGECQKRYPPCSTFKIAISLMGYEKKLLTDTKHPHWPFKIGYADKLPQWRQAHNPSKWIKNSCVWYSQLITKKIGMAKFKEYVDKFNYGNRDVSGDHGKNNGLTQAWLSSSLAISAMEQVEFLQKFLKSSLPVSRNSYNMTREILFVEELPDGWQLYGKSGNCAQVSTNRRKKLHLQQRWFIGWLQKNKRVIVFASHIADDSQQNTYASVRAKAAAKQQLLALIAEKG